MDRFASCLSLVLAYTAFTFGAVGCGPKQSAKLNPPNVVLPEVVACTDLVTGKNIQISTSIVESSAPIIFADDDAFLVAWNDLHGRSSELFTARVDKNGAAEGAARKVACAGTARDRTFSEYEGDARLVWNDSGTLKSMDYGADDGEAETLSQNARVMATAPWGAVAWIENGNLMFVSSGMTDAAKKDSPAPVQVPVAAEKIETLHMAYNGSFYGLVWSSATTNGQEIYLQRIAPDGQKLGAPVRVSSLVGSSGKPLVAWDGNHFVVAWTNSTSQSPTTADSYHIFIALVPEAGDMPRLTRKMEFQSADDAIGLAVTGKEYAIAWVSNIKQTSAAVFLQRLSLDGNPVGELVEVTDGTPTACGAPNVAWTGDGYGVVWHDDRSQTGSEAYFAFVGCKEDTEPESTPASATEVPME